MLSASSRLLVFDEPATRALFDGNPQLVEYTVGEVDVEFFNEKDFAVIFVKGWHYMEMYSWWFISTGVWPRNFMVIRIQFVK